MVRVRTIARANSPTEVDVFGDKMTSVALVPRSRALRSSSGSPRNPPCQSWPAACARQEFSLRQIAAQLGVSFIPVRRRSQPGGGRSARDAAGPQCDRRAPLELEELSRHLPALSSDRTTSRYGPVSALRRHLDRSSTTWSSWPTPRPRSTTCSTPATRSTSTCPPRRHHLGPAHPERLWGGLERYFASVTARLRRRPTRNPALGRPRPRSVLAAHRSGDPEAVRQVTLGNIDHYEQVAERGLA